MYPVEFREHKGRFIKPCPGTPRQVCCGYQIINFAQGCTLGCTYCILNYYFGEKSPVVFKNQNNLMGELESVIESQKGLIRFGTGEFTDSLLLTDSFSIYESLIPRIASTENAVLEIKTKSVNIEHLLRIGERKNIIVAWSLNSDEISQLEERNAPSIRERIDAAFEVQQHGYKVAFHFDPIIHYKGWERGYEKTIERLFRKINPENTVYISMGTLRYIPAMKEQMQLQKVSYLGGDFVRGIDGKMRYFRPLRTKMYQRVLSLLKRYVSEDSVYLCMESPEVWEDVFGLRDMNTAKLTLLLDQACAVGFAR